MNIYGEKKINDICTSNLSYDKKIQKLLEQKEEIEKTLSNIENGIDGLNRGEYLDDMIAKKKSKLEGLKSYLIKLGVDTAIFTGIGFAYPEIEKLMNSPERFKNITGHVIMDFAIIMFGQMVGDIILDSVYGYEYYKYNKETKSYERRLKSR